MGRYTGAVCKLCRREGDKLYLKGERCYGVKCALEKRNRPPGMHHWRKGKLSEYGKRLREKQKTKRYYGIYEKQFKNYVLKAAKQKGNTGINLLVLLERRLDNVVFRGGFSYSRAHARQLINHGHISVNGNKVNIASYQVNVGDVISPTHRGNSPKPERQELAAQLIKGFQETTRVDPPSWLEVITDPPTLKVVNMPAREEIPLSINEHLIIEFFSR